MSESPKEKPEKRKLPPRPRIKLPVAGQYTARPYPHTPLSYVGTSGAGGGGSYGQTPVPMTPITSQPTAVVYNTNTANEFFTHLKGIKNWTKSGLSVGEKSAFWLYEKVSSWSKRWFTHIFLFFVMFLYSILGAFLFMYVERTNERVVMEDIMSERDNVVRQMKDLWFEPSMINNSEMWMGQAKGHLIAYEKKLDQFLKQLRYQFDPADDTWNIWNAIIYCCTVYTTIAGDENVESAVTSIMDEEEERRARMERMVEDTERMEERRSRTRSPAVNRRDTESSAQRREEIPAAARSNSSRGERARDDDDGTGLRRRTGSPESQRLGHLSAPSSSADEERLKRRSNSRHRYEDDRSSSSIRRSSSLKKQIIPLNDNSLYEDVARAKRAYSHRESHEDYEYEEDDEEERRHRRPKRTVNTTVRRRKTSIVHTDEERDEISKSVSAANSSWLSWIPFFGPRKRKVDELIEESDRKKNEVAKAKREKPESTEGSRSTPAGRLGRLLSSMGNLSAEFREFCRQNPEEVRILIELRNLCIVETIVTLIVCGLGGLAFRFTEGAFETFYKCGVKRVKRDFLDSLWNYSHNMKEDDWKSMARRKLMEFEEQLHEAHEAGVQTYSGQKNWTFLNACVYCLTVISTIGYGHIYPNTKTGRALTIVYAIFGIPMFLIVLADFGKMFTRGIKFLWAFVRRLYYTGSCRKMRRTVPMQGMMKGVQAVYDFATFRRPSQMTPEEFVEIQRQQQQLQQTTLNVDNNLQQVTPESPSTPAMSTFEIDDEFNLPISVAITILVFYIFIGATAFNIIEDWGFFDSFYFVFISMSTIGFGDFVPNEPLWMMLSIVYLIFGLALTSMCINVVQVMLTDQFKQASHKIGATIGFQVSEEDGSLKPSPPEPVEMAEVHNGTSKTKNIEETKEKVAPKAENEVDEL